MTSSLPKQPRERGDVLPASVVRVHSAHGTVTVFGDAVLLTDPPVPDGRVKIVLRFESRPLWAWLIQHPDDTWALDMWAIVPPMVQHGEGVLPWLRVTVFRLSLTSVLPDKANGGYVAEGWADGDQRTGDVLRWRQDLTAPTGEETPG